MLGQITTSKLLSNIPLSALAEGPTASCQWDYQCIKELWFAQPPLVKSHLTSQASQLATAVLDPPAKIRFSLPEEVASQVSAGDQAIISSIPKGQRDYKVKGGKKKEAVSNLAEKFAQIEQSSYRAVSVGVALLRFTTAEFLVHELLPSGLPVSYVIPGGEAIPSIPVNSTASAGSPGNDLGFFIPDWVAFDEKGDLIASSIEAAHSRIAFMQRFMSILAAALTLAPSIAADEEYQRKRYGILGQIVNQGRALALYETGQIITGIKQRAARGSLDRGFSLSLPYFNDQSLRLENLHFEVIPTGWIPFDPAYVMWVARHEQANVSQKMELTPSTRRYLLRELKLLEQAFEIPGVPRYDPKFTERKKPVRDRIGALRLALSTHTMFSKRKNR
jgi:hypothetical protein